MSSSAEVSALQGRAAATTLLSAEEIAALRESLDMVEDELRKHSATLRKRAELKRLREVSAGDRRSGRMGGGGGGAGPAAALGPQTVVESDGGGSSEDERL